MHRYYWRQMWCAGKKLWLALLVPAAVIVYPAAAAVKYYLPVVGPAPLRLKRDSPTVVPEPTQISNPIALPPSARGVTQAIVPGDPVATNAAATIASAPVNLLPRVGIPAATNLAAQATNQNSNLSETNAAPVVSKAPSLQDLLPFFERPVGSPDGTNTGRILMPVFLPPRTTGPTPGSTARYESPP